MGKLEATRFIADSESNDAAQSFFPKMGSAGGNKHHWTAPPGGSDADNLKFKCHVRLASRVVGFVRRAHRCPRQCPLSSGLHQQRLADGNPGGGRVVACNQHVQTVPALLTLMVLMVLCYPGPL